MTTTTGTPFLLPLLEGTAAQVYLAAEQVFSGVPWNAAVVPLGGHTKPYPKEWEAPTVRLQSSALEWDGMSYPASGSASSLSISTKLVGAAWAVVISYNGGPLTSGTSTLRQPILAPFGMLVYQNPIANLDGFGTPIGTTLETMVDKTPLAFVVMPYFEPTADTPWQVPTQTPATLPPSTAYQITVPLVRATKYAPPTLKVTGVTPAPTCTTIFSNGCYTGWLIEGTSPAQAGNYTLTLDAASPITYVGGETLKTRTITTHFTQPLVVAPKADTEKPVITKLYIGGGQDATWAFDNAPTMCVCRDTGSGISRIDHTLTVTLAGQTKKTDLSILVQPPSTEVQSTYVGKYVWNDEMRPRMSEIIPGNFIFVHDASGTGKIVSSVTVSDAAGNIETTSISTILYIPTLVSWAFSDVPAANVTLNCAWMATTVSGGATGDFRNTVVTIASGGKMVINGWVLLRLDGIALTPATSNAAWTLPATIADGAHTLTALLVYGSNSPCYSEAAIHTYQFNHTNPACDGCDGGCDSCQSDRNHCNDMCRPDSWT